MPKKRRLTQSEIEEFIFATSGSSYQKQMLSLLSRSPYVESRSSGLGFLSFLNLTDAAVGSYSTINDPDAGSLREESEVVACAFSNVSPDPVWWRVEYRRAFAETQDELKRWIVCFRQYSDVTIFDSFPDPSSPS